MPLRAIRSVVYIGLSLLCAGILAAGAAPKAAAVPYFTGGYQLVPLMADCKPIRVQPNGAHAKCPVIVNGHQYYAEAKTYALHMTNGAVITVPAGMVTDLASVPSVVWPILPPDGPYGKASGPHDFCYRTRGDFIWRWPGHPNAKPFVGLSGHAPFTRADCDEALRQGMVALQVPAWQRIVVFEAVRLGGASGFGK